MGARFVSVDRETPMLLPPDLRDWVPKSDSGPLLGNSFCRPPWMAVREAGLVGVQVLQDRMLLVWLLYASLLYDSLGFQHLNAFLGLFGWFPE